MAVIFYGDIANQADLMYQINTAKSELQTNITTLENSTTNSFAETNNNITNLSTTVTSHINNTKNPHEVTAAQIGLDKVDNTSDEDKPVSTLQKEYITEQLQSIGIRIMSKTDYEALTSVDLNTYYIITDSNN